MSKGRQALLLCLLTLLLTSAFSTAIASAEAGPFLKVRAAGTKGEGEAPGEGTPEKVKGEGGEQRLKGKISTQPIEISTKSVQIKGAIYDVIQGQGKITFTYHEPKLVKPEVKGGCEVKFGENNTLNAVAHLAWTWNGEKKQLEETSGQPNQKPDWIMLPSELQEGATGLPAGQFGQITLKGTGCGVLAGTFKLEGSQAAAIKPEKTEEWGKSQAISQIEGGASQHFWNGKEAVGVTAELKFAGNAASLTGGVTLESESGLELVVDQTTPMFALTEGKYPVESESAATPFELTFKFLNGNPAEIVQCENTKFKGYLRRELPFLLVSPEFNEGNATCKSAGVEQVEVVPIECLLFVEFLTFKAAGEYNAALTINERPLPECYILVKNVNSKCERLILPQGIRPLTTQNLLNLLLIKVDVVDLEDVTNSKCPGGVARVTNNEFKGAVRLARLKVQ